mmetsp:Transcript_45767/g.83852  ORF Transcript_45767/g.83852 Transcript_45767/m.83852 type:complete len:234 (-) Transcript_45767:614-1315(-)
MLMTKRILRILSAVVLDFANQAHLCCASAAPSSRTGYGAGCLRRRASMFLQWRAWQGHTSAGGQLVPRDLPDGWWNRSSTAGGAAGSGTRWRKQVRGHDSEVLVELLEGEMVCIHPAMLVLCTSLRWWRSHMRASSVLRRSHHGCRSVNWRRCNWRCHGSFSLPTNTSEGVSSCRTSCCRSWTTFDIRQVHKCHSPYGHEVILQLLPTSRFGNTAYYQFCSISSLWIHFHGKR